MPWNVAEDGTVTVFRLEKSTGRALASLLAALLILSTIPLVPAAQAQPGDGFDSPALGVAFTLPDGWEARAEGAVINAGPPASLDAAQAGLPPTDLVVRVILGTFNELEITDADEFPALLTRLVASDVPAPSPEPVTWGAASGYGLEVTLPDDNVTTRVVLLAVAGGRVAIVRGLAPAAVWAAGGADQFVAWAQSLTFRVPERDQASIDSLTTNDGGVIWHYQELPPDSGRIVQAGGITYDQFDLMYMVVGQGGIMALDINTGNRISFMGPWYNCDLVDVAIGPDTKLYTANQAPDTFYAVMVVDRAGNWLRGWGERGDGDGQFAPGMPQTIVVDAAGNVWTVSEGHASGIGTRLYQFDSVGNLLQTIDLDAIAPGLSGIHMAYNADAQNFYLVGATGGLAILDASGAPLVVNLAQAVLNDVTPVDIAIAPDNNIILALDAPGLDGFGLAEVSLSGTLLDLFGFPYNAARGGPFLAGEYATPGGLIIGPSGLGYWTETNADQYTQIQAFTFTGDGLLPLGVELAPDQTDAPNVLITTDPASGGGMIDYGQTVRGSLNNRYPAHDWVFDGTVGDHIVITMTDASGADLLDPLVILRDAEGREIALNDDAGDVRPDDLGPRDSRLDFFLPATGRYTIEATRFGGRGDYLLTLEKLAE